MDISTLVPLPVRISLDFCKRDAGGEGTGAGIAVCEDLLVISCCRELHVFALPEDIARGDLGTPRELVHVRTLGGAAPMEFAFYYPHSGYMAFTDGSVCTANRRLLLVTDVNESRFGAVHVVDVVCGTHVGYVAAPGTINLPRTVATRKSLAAVSCWDSGHAGNVVRVFEVSGSGCSSHTWTAVRTIAVATIGFRFTADGWSLVVVDSFACRASIFSAKDGAFLRHIALPPDVYPKDIEECDIDGGTAGVVLCHSRGLVAVATVAIRRRDLDFYCRSLALVPGLGLVARHDAGVQFLATPDAVAMASMSFCKVAWMVAVRRGVSLRY